MMTTYEEGAQMNGFRRLVFVSIISTYFLIFIGGLVRVAGAGMGCPDWPKCFGRWVPPLSVRDLPSGIDPTLLNVTLAWIEYLNRLAGVTVGLLILAVAIVALMKFRRNVAVLYPALAAAVLTAFQGWQGGKVVASSLAPLMVSAHLVISFVIVCLLLYVAQKLYYAQGDVSSEETRYPPNATVWVALLWVGAVLQVVLGTQVRAGLQVVSGDYPLLTDAEWLSRVGLGHDLHMIAGILLALFTWFVGISILKMTSHPSSLVRRTIWGMMILMLVQILFGFFFLLVGLTAVLQLFHLWIAGIFIGLTMLLYFGVRQKYATREHIATRPAGMLASIVAGALFAVVSAVVVVGRAETSRAEMPVLWMVPPFSFVERSGEPFTEAGFYGKISIVDFFFTSCHGPCPVMGANLAQLYRTYAHSDKVQIVSFTVDPVADSLPVLQDYAVRFGVNDRRWLFVRGDTGSVSRLCEEGFKVSGDLPGNHSTRFILVDANGNVRGLYPYDSEGSLALLQEHIRELARTMP